MRKFNITAILISAFILAGCARYTAVPSSTSSIGPMDFQTDAGWNERKLTGKHSVWTVDGIALQQLHILRGVEDGDKLFIGYPRVEGPAFSSDFILPEQVEFLSASLKTIDLQNVVESSVRPLSIGAIEAVRFEFSAENKEGLDYLGTAVSFTHHEELYALIYIGTKEHYFGKMLPSVNGMIDSLHTSGAVS